jgi:hypothetical protein
VRPAGAAEINELGLSFASLMSCAEGLIAHVTSTDRKHPTSADRALCWHEKILNARLEDLPGDLAS